MTHILPAGRVYRLGDGQLINNDLQPCMLIVLQDGVLGTTSAVELCFEPPKLPLQVKSGLFLSRVIGTIKHRGLETSEVSWPGNTVSGSPDHRFYSVTRAGYVSASDLQVGEVLRGDDGEPIPVTSVGERKLGLTELYNIEVEQFHNYHVGSVPSVLVHNGAAGVQYINTPFDEGPARSTNGRSLPSTTIRASSLHLKLASAFI